MSAAISIGGNLPSRVGDASATITAALTDIAKVLKVTGISRYFRSPAFPVGSGPDFVNAVVMVDSERTPEKTLDLLHRIEAAYGRERTSRWAARTLDLDLLFVDDIVLPSLESQMKWTSLLPERQQSDAPESLILPHPRIQDRAFVLVPLAEVAPEWCHPVTGLSVAQMKAMLPEADKAAICPI